MQQDRETQDSGGPGNPFGYPKLLNATGSGNTRLRWSRKPLWVPKAVKCNRIGKHKTQVVPEAPLGTQNWEKCNRIGKHKTQVVPEAPLGTQRETQDSGGPGSPFGPKAVKCNRIGKHKTHPEAPLGTQSC